MFEKMKERLRVIRLIRNAIDSYPGGICFAAADGRPILVNRRINEICYALTDHTITNAAEMWEELSAQALPELYGDPGDPRIIACALPDASVWQFRKTPCRADGMQVIRYEASDITQLYEYRRQLRENNARDAQLHIRQRELLRNIVQNNQDRELLHAKMRIHDDFGRLLIMTENMLTGRAEDEGECADGMNAGEEPGMQQLFTAWRDVILDMENASPAGGTKETSPQKELVKVADMIGCGIEFHGAQPAERQATLLLYAAIREALTNAVRHAGADQVIVTITSQKDRYHVEISDNGDPGKTQSGAPAAWPLKEGSGLNSLRRKLESAGADLQYRYDNGVVMILTIPKETYA